MAGWLEHAPLALEVMGSKNLSAECFSTISCAASREWVADSLWGGVGRGKMKARRSYTAASTSWATFTQGHWLTDSLYLSR